VQPETRYAKSGDVHIAYQVFGEGPFDLVFVPGWMSHLDMVWENPLSSWFFKRLASFSRVICFDKRGTGMSDRDAVAPSLEVRMDDVRAVMDAVGSERAALYALSEGGPLAIVFAATYPQRVSALVLNGTLARATEAPDYPEGAHMRAVLDQLCQMIDAGWGQGRTLSLFAPSQAASEHARREWGRVERAVSSPGAARAYMRILYDIDVRPVVPTIRVPTLVIHRTDDHTVSVPSGRWLAGNLPGARYVELPGDDHIPWLGDATSLLDEVQEFLTGTRGETDVDRVLATVLFTDIVGSTEHAVQAGDHRWREVLDRHDAVVRQQVDRFRGRFVKSTGDGSLGTFDGPARAVRAACAVRDSLRGLGIQMRAGLHTGEIELRSEDVGGIAVHIGARVAEVASPAEVLVSSTVKDLVAGSGLRFADRGTHNLHGVPGEWRLFAVEG
jgi:pimeloyl-ACP methyl ester carboxylesterase